MCNCTGLIKQFEKRGGASLESLNVPVAPKRKRSRGGKRQKKFKLKQLAIKRPDKLKEFDKHLLEEKKKKELKFLK
jgi:hypothetical protein